jgi:leader peptidase (prepilin peptidase) / N-methyltransferase
MILTKTLIFIIGLIVGSYLNVCICRIPDKKSLNHTSHCSNCHHKLDFIELIPILGYFINNRKCKHCGEKLSIKNPIVEILTAVVFLLLYTKYSFSIYFFEYAVLTSLIITVTFIELEKQDVPEELIIFCLIAGLLFNIYAIKVNMINGILGFMLGGAVFLIIAMITQGAFGGGNIKYMAVLGLYMGWKLIIVIALLSFVLGAIVSIILTVSKIKSRKDYISLGPFIAVSTIIVIFYGQELLQLYTNNL